MNESERDELLIRIDGHVKALVTVGIDHETRLRTLEATKYKQAGMLTILSASVSAVIAWFSGHRG